ncbi:MAG: hypothetical protein HAW59_05435 [Betaproteobacteria bacterium]|nr:hypothetical protein [Betaproteobacteria bacterium]
MLLRNIVMKIIIVPDDAAGFAAAPPKTLEFPAKRLWVGLAAAACILVFAVYALARHTAYGWLEAKTPLAQSLVAELETRLDAENRRRQKGTRAAFGAQFAELRARLAELRANGAMLAGRVGLAEGEMFAAVPDACAAAELKQTGAAEEELAHSANLRQKLSRLEAKTGRNLFLIDPLGNVMLSYPAQKLDIKKVIKDLKRLFKYSRIG